MEKTNKGMGILGGTFDPVHYGHLIIAEAVREGFDLEKILFIPSGQPPHKDNSRVSDAEHRYNMLKAAISTNPHFDISRIEIDRDGYTYSVDTLSQLKSIYGCNTTIYFIIGADIVQELTTWREFEKVFTLCDFIAVFRPGNKETSFLNEIDRLKSEYNAKIHTLEAPLIEISSTEIRDRVAEGKSIKYFLPEPVEQYIYANAIYSDGDTTKREVSPLRGTYDSG